MVKLKLLFRKFYSHHDVVNSYRMFVSQMTTAKCSICHRHNPIFPSSFMTHHQIFNKSNMM